MIEVAGEEGGYGYPLDDLGDESFQEELHVVNVPEVVTLLRLFGRCSNHFFSTTINGTRWNGGTLNR